MISVPNHRPLLSGNKLWWLLLLLLANHVSAQNAAAHGGENSRDTTVKTYVVDPKLINDIGLGKVQPHMANADDNALKFFSPSKAGKDKYTLSLFLPLYFDSLDREQRQKTQLTISREFYKGFMIGADTLKKCGLSLDIHVFDSEKPWNYHSVEDTLQRNKTDLIVGPIMESRIWYMDSLSKLDKINYISPLLTNEKSTNKDHYFQSRPSLHFEALSAAQVVKKNFRGYKVLIINQSKLKDNILAQTFIAQFNKDSITVLDCNGKGVKGLPETLPLGDSNVILIVSKSEVFVSSVLSQLRVATQKITVIGDFQWQFFKNFEGDLWEKFHVHILSPYFIDYENPALNNFINRYRAKYNEEPSVWSFIGFDEMVYYGSLLHTYGLHFQDNIQGLNIPLLHTTYSLRQGINHNGWQNEYVNVLKFENYKLSRVIY